MIHAVLNGDFSHALETLLAVSVLILVVLMVRRPVSRQFGAGVVYMLWVIPVVRFFLPPLSTPVSLLNLNFAPVGQTSAEMLTPLETEATLAAAPPVVAAWTPGPEMEAVAEPSTLSLAAQVLPVLLVAVVAAWLAGTVYLIARNLLAHRTFMQTVEREAMPVSAPMADLVTRIAAETGLRRPPRLVASLISRGPFVTGLFRPVVVMPAWFEDDYTPMEARAALAHELMHVRRGDLWALQVSELFVAAMWFNPLAYIARNAFRTDQEAACDADVLSRCQTSPHAYGSTLVKAARLHLPEPAMAAGRLPLTHALKERLTRMTYPAPSSRRRMIGFGAALLFGASTLAITASVASAGEPESTETYEFRIETDTHWISDGDDDRQIVLLGDPMSKVMPIPPVPPEVGELQRRIEIDVAELTGPEVLGPIISWHESEDWEEFADLAEEMSELHGELVEEVVTEEDGKRIVKRIHRGGKDMTPEQRDALEAKLEAKAAKLEARMAARESEMEAHEARIDQHVIMLEKRIEANADEVERIMEERFGADFEARVEAQAEVIEFLVDSCEDAELATGETRIIERADSEGEMFRLACIEGNRENLKAPATLAAIEAYPGLSADEIASFKKAAKGHKGKHVFVISNDSSDASEPPEPPAPPEPPLKGE
ncbi:MAG: M56 family metallopeptidase [Hyphomonas sp.]